MAKTQKFVAIVKEMDEDRENTLGFSAATNCSDVEKTDEAVIVNYILQKHCLKKGDFTNVKSKCCGCFFLLLHMRKSYVY